MEDHIYGIELGEFDPLAPQPDKINVALKPHQSAALAKAIHMERVGTTSYEISEPVTFSRYRPGSMAGRFRVTTNVGVIADIVGYGKTLTALSIIAASPTSEIHRDELRSETWTNLRTNVGQCRIEYQRPADTVTDAYIHTTLVVVPRGPVFVQWERTLAQTGLKYLAIDSLPQIRRVCPGEGADAATVKAFFEGYDVVLVKNTSLKTLMSFYAVPYREPIITAWDRIMVDEAHDIINTVPLYKYRFLWLITASYKMLNDALHRTSRNIVDTVRDVINEERINYMMIRGKLDFVKKSFDIPAPIEHTVMCSLPRDFAAVHRFFTPQMLERVNAGDFAGVITSLGGRADTEDNIVDLLTRDLKRDIRNKEREIAYTRDLDIDEAIREARLQTLNSELTRTQDKLEALRVRVTQLHEKTCPICYDALENPIFLPCTHIYCAVCLVNWLRSNTSPYARGCPTCRAPINARQLMAVVNQAPATESADETVSKEDAIMRIIQNKPNGRFLVFSSYDNLFYRISGHLKKHRIEAAEMKGSTHQMMRLLERFNAGELRVFLINTHHAASGIEITKATDVIIAHSMGSQAEQCIGRAQRTGRTEALNIHRLYYPHEMEGAGH